MTHFLTLKIFSPVKKQRQLSKKKVYILPSKPEIMRRLQTVDSEFEDVYPFIANSAGEQFTAAEIVADISMSINALNNHRALPVTRMFMTEVPRWIDLLVDDPEVAEAAKEILTKPPYAPRVPPNWE